MPTFAFELRTFRNRRETGRRGTVGPFGEVTTRRPKTTFWRGADIPGFGEVRLESEGLPDTRYRFGASSADHDVDRGHLFVEGTEMSFDYDRRAFRNRSRALTIHGEHRDYTYSVLQVHRRVVLERPGIRVGFERGKSSTGKGGSSFGVATGDVDALDMALAIIFEEVNTSALTSMGATSAMINKIANLPRSNE
ncbi:hypothetical protein ABZX93_18720 [Streptomyces sp. NPDC006632]|uniref:hypothetical protein n=1 Tax=unclassified Streptomyces TaxID=2593676 RepID=UPI002E1C7BD7